MRCVRLLLLSLLLLLLVSSHVTHALRVASAVLSNATVGASSELRVVLDFEGDPVPDDAVFSFQLHRQLLLHDATSSTSVDTALLATQLDGELHVAIVDGAVVIARGADATELVPVNSTLSFRLLNLTMPPVAGAFGLGMFSMGNESEPTMYDSFALPSVWIAPGRLWNARAAFSNLIRGRSSALNLSFTPSNGVPGNGSVVVHLPRLYADSDAALQAVTLAGTANVSGELQLTVTNQLRFSWATTGSGGLESMVNVVVQLNGLQHPLLEGPIGRSIRIETTDADNNIIDQEIVDVAALRLEKAFVQLSKRSLLVQEADAGGQQYSLSLSAPPQFAAGISVALSAYLSDSVTAASDLVVEPAVAHFSGSNWTERVTITVRVPGDQIALPSASQFVISHAIVENATETSFAPIYDVVVFVEDDDLPLVHLSSRYVAVAESLRNDSYNVTLLARPSSDVTVEIESPSPLVHVTPSSLVFTTSSWADGQTVSITAASAGLAPTRALRGFLSHRVSSLDTTFSAVVPQSNIAVYYEPLALVSCVEPCRPGYYPAINSSTNLSQCIACPLGHYCPGECGQPVPCVAGTSSSTRFAANSSVCVDCAVGSYANMAGMSVCSPCPGGASCPRKNSTFEPCPIGTFSLQGQGSCQACPPGTFSNPTFRDRCDSCPVGSFCAGNTTLPVVCANGTYSAENGAKPCGPCPAGYVCTNNSTAPAKCPDGTYSLSGDAQCRLCPQGYYCPNTALTPIKCGQGTYSHTGSTNCTICPFGHTCSVPDLPKACGLGEISNGNHSACVACPPGYACPIGGAIPVQCAAGSFSTGGAMVCTACAAGYACNDTTSTQRVPCLAGTYSTGGAATCTPCPAGYACPTNNSATFTPCPSGWYSPQGSAACTECPRGYFCDVPYELPKNCSLGSYSMKASSSCIPCDPGYECPRSDQLPQPCPVGYYSGGAVANCKACRPGYKCSLASTNPTPPGDACPMGGYCNPPTTFFLCPAGTYGNVTAGESVDQACAPCPEGFYCEMGSTPLTMQACPAGYVCPVGTKRASQFPCPAGKYSSLSKQSSLDVCLICPQGSFCVQGSATPVVCPQGYYCPEGTMAANQYPCPAGTYSGPRTGLTIASDCKPCELGSYCPQASSTPTSCPAGTYNPSTGSAGIHECLDCPPGWSCPRVGQFEYVDRCAKGHFCPSGTVVATANPCPAGTYTERIDLIRAQDCTICPLRHACPEGTGGEAQTMLDCGAGFFCPNGTAYAKQFPCPPGWWSSSTALADASECDICPVGKYCSGGKSFIDGPCSAGYYCPLGTPSSTKFPCPSGTYTSKTWLFEASQCDDCPPGYYCPAGSVAPIPCKPGSYSSFNNTKTVGPGTAWPDCVTCPAGYYCVEAAVVPAPCGKGNYSTRGSKSCSKCEAGYFCNSNTTTDTNMRADVVSWLAPGALFGKCYNGTYCPPGSDHEPALEIDACPRGYFCPKATPAPVICPAGTYSNLTGQDEMSDCIPTPAGYFSLEGSLQPTGPCDPGFYCPVRSTSRTQIPCPARYYLNRTGGQSEDDCGVCVAGSYCPRGSAYPADCPTGSYCRTGVSSPEPCPIGTYSNATGIKSVEDCLVCPPGMYCDSTGLTVPRGPCDPGYYCTMGSYTSAPMSYETTLFGVTNRNVGGQCPRGSFCPLGSAIPSPCPPGTYNNFTGLEIITQCVQCPPGKYCETPGLVLPTGDCFSGYYCTGGASTPTQVATPPGSFTLNGATAPVPCPAGQFNTYAMQEQCVECPAGYFCESPGTVRPTICPKGNYCPKSTSLAIKCPPGTLNSMEGLVSVLQCQSCPAGFFCDSFGLIEPSGTCLEGFVCSGGSPVSNPVAADYGFVCPIGHYCPAGSGSAIQCPRGSFRASTGGVNLASCSLCPGGSFCGEEALIAPSGLCQQGYFCTLNVSTATPSGDLSDGTGGSCPKGSYCPQGASQPLLCPEGTFSDDLRAALCTPCPAGYFCPLGTADYASNACPQGYYCPIGTKRDVEFPCLPGTFGNRTGLQDVSQCTPAPGGMYIEYAAAVKPTGYCKSGFYCSGGSATSTPPTVSATGGPCLHGTNCPEGSAVPIVCDAGFYCSSTNTERALPCDAGFYCVQGSFTANPTGQNNSLGIIGDVCPPGHYCPQGTSNPIPCPPGTYSENPQNQNETQCFPCPPGFLCSVSGIVTPYEKCPAGFICTGGEREATQRCPKGSECPLGSSAPRTCPAGTFSDELQLGQCKVCPARYFCVAGTITPEPCPAGYFCPFQTASSTKYPCPPGTFSNSTLLASGSECAPCSPGKFCSGAAPTDRVSGDCAPGYHCIGGATTATPTDGVLGDLCAEGFMCFGGAWLPDPTDGVTGAPCQAGFYCPRGSSASLRCVKGTYNAFEKQSACVPCPAGGYCDTNATAPVPCPRRYFCPEATTEPILCPPGTYGHVTSLEAASQCAPCAAGKFCIGGTLTASCSAGYYCKLYNLEPNPPLNTTASALATKPLGFDFGGPCPLGHYCPEGVLDPLPCPSTTARLETHATSVDDCGPCPAGMSCENGAYTVPCPAGHYCAYAQSGTPCPSGTYNSLTGQAKLADCKPCRAGKLCNSTGIVDLTELYNCPTGHYCLEASTSPEPCPKGRFRRTRGATSVDDCELCTGGSFCGDATVEPTVCESRVYCPVGSGAPTPCPGGSYCPYNSSAPIECPAGFYCPMQVALPIACERGFYCPTGSVAPLACPLGHIGRVTPLNGVLSRLNDACEPCPAGTYGIDPNRTRCDVCLEGYVCLEATRSSHPKSKEEDNGYPCPAGYVCPAGTVKELPCPSGTYQPNLQATNASDCRLCPANSYQNNVGQASCLPCSKSAYAGVGATVCTCKGSHRAFQMTDGYCICEPGFEFYDQDMVLRSDEDDDVDCQPIVYDRCAANQVRSDSGACVPASQTSCEKSCGNSTGTLVSSLGICQCDKQVDVDTVCDKKCRDSALQLRVDPTTGALQMFDPVTGELEPLAGESTAGIISKVSCAADAGGCQLHTLALSTGGFAGSYDVPANVEAATLAPSPQRRRRLASGSTTTTISNPMVCLHVGEGIFFDLTVPGSYPVYLKDSMLNTNPNFDYGAFRALATRVKSNTSTVSAFAFSFTEAGIYVFGNSLNGAAKTVITVMQAGTACPTEAPIVPLSEKNLISVSVKRRTDDIILAPDWSLIIGLLGGLVGMVVAVIAGLYYFRTKSWATSSTRRRLMGYRATSKATDLATMHSKGVAVANRSTAAASAAQVGDSQQATLTPAPVMILDDGKPPPLDSLSPRWSKNLLTRGDGGFQPDLARWEEEDLDLRELVDRLQQHHDAVTKCFDDQKGDVQSLLQHLQTQAAELKQLLVNALTAGPATQSPLTTGVSPRNQRGDRLTTSQTTAVVSPQDFSTLRSTLHEPITSGTAVATSSTPPSGVPSISNVAPGAPVEEAAVPPSVTSAILKPLALPTSLASMLTVPAVELDKLRQAVEVEAQELVARQEQMRQEHMAMLRDKFPQLSSDEVQRLIDEYSNDLSRLLSSLHIEAQKADEDVKTLITARVVMAESHGRAMSIAAEQQKSALEQEQQQRLAMLESKFAEEEDEIEREYQRELQRLEQEFAALQDDVEGDETLPHSDMDDDMAFDGVDQEGDEGAPSGGFGSDEDEVDGIGLAQSTRKPSPRAAALQTTSNETPPHSAIDADVERAIERRKRRLLDRLLRLRAETASEPGHASPLTSPTRAQVAIVDALEDEIREVQQFFKTSVDEQRRQLEHEADNRKRLLRERIAKRMKMASLQPELGERTRELRELETEEHTAVATIDRDLEDQISRLEGRFDNHAQEAIMGIETKATAIAGDVEKRLAECRARHDKEAAALRDRLEMERKREESILKDRLDRRRKQRLEEMARVNGSHDQAGSSEAQSEEDLEENARQEWRDLESDLGKKKLAATQDLLRHQFGEVAAVVSNHCADAEGQVDRCRTEVVMAETEFERVRGEHERAMATLRAALDAERTQQMRALQDRLAARRAAKLESARSAEEQAQIEAMMKEETTREVDTLDRELDQRAAEIERSKRRDHRIEEDALLDRLMGAVGDASVSLAAQTAVAAAEQAEMKRVSAGLTTMTHEQEARDGKLHKLRLRDRLVRRRRVLNVRMDESVVVEPDSALVDVAARALDSTIEDQLQRVRDQLAAGSQSLRDHLRQDAQRSKKALHDRLSRKREAANVLQANSGADMASGHQLEADEITAVRNIDADLKTQLSVLDARAAMALQNVVEAAESEAANLTDDLDRLLSSCRAQYDHESGALHERLRVERKEREQALRDRLGKRRAQRLSAIETARQDAGIPITAAEEAAIEAELAQAEQQELSATEESLATEERNQLQALHDVFAKRVGDIIERVESTARHAQSTALEEQDRAEAELKRILDDHERERRALAATQEAERKQQQQLLRDRLDQRRVKRLAEVADETLKSQLIAQLDAEDELDTVALLEQQQMQSDRSQADLRRRQEDEASALLMVVSEASGKVAASEAGRVAADAAREVELRRLALELERALSDRRDDDAVDATNRKARLKERLDARKKMGVSTDTVDAGESVGPLPQFVVARVMEDTIGDELDRINQQYAQSLKHHNEQIDDEAARRKALLRERIELKRKAMALKGSINDGSEATALIEEEAAAGAAAIDKDAASMRQRAKKDTEHERELATKAVEEIIQSKEDELNRLLDACRREHESETAALRRTMEQERQRREAALRDRLAKRREQKLSELLQTHNKVPLTELANLEHALDEELAREERHERTLLEQRMAEEEAVKLAEACTKNQQRVAELFAPIERQMLDQQNRSHQTLESIESELRRVQGEHERELTQLKASLDAEQKRQEQKLQENLAARRATRQKNAPEENVDEKIALEEALELVTMREMLEQRASKAMAEARDDQEQEKLPLVSQMVKASADAIAADAARAALEAARQAEMDRIRAEFDAGRLDAEQDHAAGSRLAKSKLDERRTQRRRAKRNGDGSSDPESTMFEVLNGAIDDELARALRQYQESLRQQLGEIDAETAGRKAMLRERIELKRKALALRAADAPAGAPQDEIRTEQAVLEKAGTVAEATIDAECESKKRAAEAATARRAQAAQQALQSAVQATTDDLEKLLEACRIAHDRDSEALKQSLEQERQRREMALRERLAKRREKKLAETEKLMAGKSPDEQRVMREAVEKELEGEERNERDALARSLTEEERQQLTETQASLQRQSAEIFSKASRAARDRQAAALASEAATEDALRRVREDHDRELSALKKSLDAERRRQEQKLQDKLAARRAQRRSEGMSEEALAVEEAAELAELSEELHRRAAQTVSDERRRHDESEESLVLELAQRRAESAAADAARIAIEGACQAELDRIAAEFEASCRQLHAEDSTDAESRKAKLQDRLSRRRGREKAKQSDSASESRAAGKNGNLVPTDARSAVADSLDGAVDDELERTQRQYEESLRQRLIEIDSEAAGRKAILRERIELKRKALAMRAAAALPGTAQDEIRAEQAALDEAMVAAEATIDVESESQKRAAEESTARREQAVQQALQSAVQATTDDLEKLLEACRIAHDRDAEALKQSLEQERQRREMALRERLAKRREQKLAETEKLMAGKSADEQRVMREAVEEELEGEERREHDALSRALAEEEAQQLAKTESAMLRRSTDMLAQADRAARDRQATALASEAAIEDELRRVQDDHERELLALKSSLDAERRRQEQKLQDKLAARRAQRRSEGMSEEALAVEEALEVLELGEELQQRAARAVEDEKRRHDESEESLETELAKRRAELAAASAARDAIEAARQAELDRIAAEFAASRHRSQEDDATRAQAQKAKLQDRLSRRRGREKAMPHEKQAKDRSTRRLGTLEPPVDAKAAAADTLVVAVDEELERIKKQYAESVQRRVAQAEGEAVAKKAALRDRIEQKRRALAMRGAVAHGDTDEDEQNLREEQAAAEATIDEELASKTRELKEEADAQLRVAQTVLQSATDASGDELERLLQECQRAHAADAEALRRSLEQDRLLKEQTLRDRLARRREQKLAEAMQHQKAGASQEEMAIERAAIEKELQAEEQHEQTQLNEDLAEEEARRLAEAEAAQQRQAAEMIQQMEHSASVRGEQARAVQIAAEDELRRVQQEHERELATLTASLSAERKRQEQKLQDKLAARRAQRELRGDTSDAQDERAIAAEEKLEHLKLQDELRERAEQALQEERRRHEEQEQTIMRQITQAAAEASAAEAARKAIEAARQAEIDRIAAEFEASRRRAMDEDGSDSKARRAKLDERLAQKRQRPKKQDAKSAPPLIAAATRKVIVVQRSLRSITESQAEKEIERLCGEHAAACEERFASLEQDAAVRKARLAERIAKKRNDVLTKPTVVDTIAQTDSLERGLQMELEAESRLIDDELAVEKKKILDELARAQEQVAAGVQAAAQRTAEEMEHLLVNCKQAHEEETKNLQRALQLERQRQEKTLQDRIAKRKQQRQKVQQEQQQQQEESTSNSPGETATAAAAVVDDGDDEREKQELETQLKAKEAAVWEEMRRKQEEELLTLTRETEAAALKKQEEAKRVQESAQVELDRLKREHEAEMATLTASMEAEQKRQQQQLQQRIAARRSKQQKQQKDVEDLAETERLAKQLEEQEAADKLALEQQMQTELARRIEQERERQRQEEAELAARVAQANIDAAAADAARKAMDAAREVELERLAKEFDEKSRELRQTHMTDLMNQKQKLEARVAAKKQKKMMELEAKRELERQKLRERQEAEERAARAEQQRAQEAVGDALAMAMASEESGDSSAPPAVDEEVVDRESKPAGMDAAKEPTKLLEETSPPATPDAKDSLANQANDHAARADQQLRDIAAIQQLFDTQVIPLRMPLMAAVELVLSQRHQQETSLLLAQQYKRKTQAIRAALRDLLQQKAAAKALMMRTYASDQHEQRLQTLDAEYDELIRVAEQAVIQAQELHAAEELQNSKDQQLAELQFLLNYFSGMFAAALQRVQQQEQEHAAQVEQAAKLRGMLGVDGSVDARLPRRFVLASAGNDIDDRINELRARLQLEADERIQQLVSDKHSELQRLESELDAELRRIGQEFDRLADQERAAMEAAFLDRVRGLASESRQRAVLQNENDDQMARLLVMLQGRRAQQEARARRLVASKLPTLEREYDRKIQIVTAKMMQRIVEEKELLLQKQKALAQAIDPSDQKKTGAEKTSAGSPTAGGDDSKTSPARGRLPRDDADERDSNDVDEPSDLRRLIEIRLRKIETLLQNVQLTSSSAAVTVTQRDVDEYKKSLAHAIEDACHWRVVIHDPATAETLLQIVPRETLDPHTQTRVDFANALVQMMDALDTSGPIDHVAVAATLPPTGRRPAPTSGHDVALTHLDTATRTLFVRAACFAQLSVGQLALLLVHSVAEAQTQSRDIADPIFMGCVYRLLVRCYERLFLSSTATPTANANAPRVDALPRATARADPKLATPRPDRGASTPPPGHWKSHVFEMESFLSGFDLTTTSDEARDSMIARSPLQRQASTRASLAMSRTLSSHLLLGKQSSSSTTEMEALVVQERRQFLQEKLDTAEKLYAHVLRQYQEQKQSLEYVQEMLEQEKDGSSADSRPEAKTALLQRLDELHHEAEGLETALTATRRERDELFAQCQTLRDELEHLPRSRPTTKAESKP